MPLLLNDSQLELFRRLVTDKDANGYSEWDRAIFNHDVASINDILGLYTEDEQRLALLNTSVGGSEHSALAESLDYEPGALEAFKTLLSAYPTDESRFAALLQAKYGNKGTLLHNASSLSANFVPVILAACRTLASRLRLLNTTDDQGNIALHLHSKKIAIASILNAYPDIKARLTALNTKNNKGNTPLQTIVSHCSNRFHCANQAQTVLDAYPDDKTKVAALNAKNNNGDTALHLAAETGYAEVVNTILSAYPDDKSRLAALNERNKDGLLPLQCANSQYAAKAILDAYVSNDAKFAVMKELDDKGRSELERAAIQLKNSNYLDYLFSLYPSDDARYEALSSQDAEGNSLFHKVLSYDYMFQWKEQNRAVVKSLFSACPKEHLPTLLNLQNNDGNNAFHKMLDNSIVNVNAIRDILSDIPGDDNQATIIMMQHKTYGVSLLHRAARSLHPDSINLMLNLLNNQQKLAALNARNNDGNTPLHLAARSIVFNSKKLFPDNNATCLTSVQAIINVLPDAQSKLAALTARNNNGETPLQLIADLCKQDESKKVILSYLETTKEACEAELHPPRNASWSGMFWFGQSIDNNVPTTSTTGDKRPPSR